MTEGVLFDLDGTLADSLSTIAAALNETLAAAGYPTHTTAAVATMVGDGAATLIDRGAPPGADRAALLADLKTRYAPHSFALTKPFPGVVQLLRSLEGAGARLAVLSNKPHAMTVLVVQRLFPETKFVHVFGQREDVPMKPDPTVALQLADALGLQPSQCAMVGDSQVDVQTGRRAGMLAVGVTWGFRSRVELSTASPDVLVDTVAELGAALLAGAAT